MTSILSLDKLKHAIHLKEKIEALQTQLHRILGGHIVSKPTRKKARKTMSASARAKISAAAKARWAKIKGTSAGSSSTKTAPKKKGGLTPAGRAKLAAAMKARWAAKKKAAAAPSKAKS